MSRYANIFGALLTAYAVIWFISVIVSEGDIDYIFRIFSLLGFVVVALYVGCYFLIAAGWKLFFDSVAENGSFHILLQIFFISQLAKYIPGNISQHVGRVILAKRHGLSVNATLFTVFMEMIWVVAIAALLALVAVLSAQGRLFGEIPQVPRWWVLAILVASAMLAAVLGHRLFGRLTRWWGDRKGVEFRSVTMPPLRTFALVGILYALNFLILGLLLEIIATQVFDSQGGGVLLLSGIFAVAWIAGFIMPGAPAGLGVREVVLVAALTPIYGKEAAIGVTAMLRIVTVLGDIFAFLIGIAMQFFDRLPTSDS